MALYYTPHDRLIQASGIRPDVRVGTEEVDYADSLPTLETERDLEHHLRPEDFGRSSEDANADQSAAVVAAGDDVQLAAAVEHLQAWDTVVPRLRRQKGRR